MIRRSKWQSYYSRKSRDERFERIFSFHYFYFLSVKNECQRKNGDGKGQGPLRYRLKKKGQRKRGEREKEKIEQREEKWKKSCPLYNALERQNRKIKKQKTTLLIPLITEIKFGIKSKNFRCLTETEARDIALPHRGYQSTFVV